MTFKINYLVVICVLFYSVAFQAQVKYSKEDYSKQCLSIIDKGRKELHKKLPFIIEKNLNIIKNDVNNKIREKTISVSRLEYREAQEELNYGTLLEMLNNEQQANHIYMNIVRELSEVNSDFFNNYNEVNKILKFKDFYKLPPVRLAEEVTLYLEDAIEKEKNRVSRENKSMSVNIGLSIVELIPGATAVTKILEGVKYGAKAVRAGQAVASNSTFISKVTSKLITNKEKALILIRKISNAEKRAKISARIANVGALATVTQLSTTSVFIGESDANLQEKINEFSKGMTAVYLQNLRDYIKDNQKMIP